MSIQNVFGNLICLPSGNLIAVEHIVSFSPMVKNGKKISDMTAIVLSNTGSRSETIHADIHIKEFTQMYFEARKAASFRPANLSNAVLKYLNEIGFNN